jgi:beta-lactamase superfamily II metal-dependent hydrolase
LHNEEPPKDDPVLEIYFIDVGQGDSTFIVTPGRKKILVDGD